MSKPSSQLFSEYIRILGRGKKGTRSLSFEEAQTAMQLIIDQQVEDVQLGAFLMLLRVKEESPEEIAGFVSSIRKQLPDITRTLKVDLDWSSYAGKRRQQPWFLLAALALSNHGIRILMHGSDGHTPGRVYTPALLNLLGLNCANDWQQVEKQLACRQFSFIHLHNINPQLQQLISLKPLLGLRSPINTLVRLINPAQANASISSVFHPAYTQIQTQAARLLKQTNFCVFKGEGGEIECRPEADTKLTRLVDKQISSLTLPRLSQQKPQSLAPLNIQDTAQVLTQFWREKNTDTYALSAIIQTLAASLLTLEPKHTSQEALQHAHSIWHARQLDFI